jgi:hypothetical protein
MAEVFGERCFDPTKDCKAKCDICKPHQQGGTSQNNDRDVTEYAKDLLVKLKECTEKPDKKGRITMNELAVNWKPLKKPLAKEFPKPEREKLVALLIAGEFAGEFIYIYFIDSGHRTNAYLSLGLSLPVDRLVLFD